MAKIQEKPLHSKPKALDFLCCFGTSRKICTRNSPESMESGRRRRRSLLSVFRLNLKKSATGKTTPVDFTAVSPVKKDDDFPATSEKSTCPLKPRRRPGDELRPGLSEFKPATTDQNLDEKDKAPKKLEIGPKLIFSKYRTPELVGNGVISQRSSPVKTIKRKLTRNPLSLPNLHPKPETNTTAGDQPRKKLSDPIAGILILTMTLLIILLWGKLCAIISTSLWLYILPRLTSSPESDNGRRRHLKNVEMNSDLYSKKKVVYEGFLERDRRSSPAIHSPRLPDVSHDEQIMNT